MRRLPTFATAVTSALLFAAPAFADSHKAGNAMDGGMKDQTSLQAQCERLSDRYLTTEAETGPDANVLESAVLRREGEMACNNGNYSQGIDKLQQALQILGASPGRGDPS